VGISVYDLAGEQHMSRAEARDYPVLRVGGSAWGGLMTMCPTPDSSALFWQHVKPAADIKAEVEAFREQRLGGPDGKYVAVHLRWLEG